MSIAKRIISLFLLFTLIVTLTGCKDNDALAEPTDGLLFALDPASSPQFDEYELNLKNEDEGFIVVTLKKSENYQVKWSQNLVDEQEGKTFEVHTLQGYNTRKPGDLTEYAEVFQLTFKDGKTDHGRLVKVSLAP